MRRLAGAILLLIAACGSGDGPEAFPAGTEVRIESHRATFTIPVEIAATPESRQRGLMGRRHLPPDRGMLFIYAEEEPRGFWMKNCLVRIDAAFLATDGHILNVAEMVPEPGREFPRSYPSAAPVRLVLEMPGGWFRDHGVAVGDRVDVPEELLRLRPE